MSASVTEALDIPRRRDLAISAEYDEDKGYAGHFRAALQVDVPPDRPRTHPFYVEDLYRLKLLSSETAFKLSLFMDGKGWVVDPARMGREMVRQVLGDVLNDDLLAAIHARWGTHFWPIHMSLQRLRCSEDNRRLGMPQNSTRWHCDGGPFHHLRLIVYLDPVDSHDSSTGILNRATTDALKRVGYIFCPLEKRTQNIRPTIERIGLTYAPTILRLGAGEGVLFEPAQIAHRSFPPSYGYRTALHLGLVPALTPWQTFVTHHFEAMRAAGFPNLS